jgi:hypothetical protein
MQRSNHIPEGRKSMSKPYKRQNEKEFIRNMSSSICLVARLPCVYVSVICCYIKRTPKLSISKP